MRLTSMKHRALENTTLIYYVHYIKLYYNILATNSCSLFYHMHVDISYQIPFFLVLYMRYIALLLLLHLPKCKILSKRFNGLSFAQVFVDSSF